MADTDDLLRKLRPLLPREVEHWIRVLNTAEPDVRALVERQVAATAQKHLGDLRGKILLPPPPPHKARGPIRLGTVVYDDEKYPAGLHPSELLQHLVIVGRSGSGKTNLAFHLMLQLLDQGIPWVFVDWKRTGRHLLPILKHPVSVYTAGRSLAPLPFNPFCAPPGIDRHTYIGHLTEALARAYTLGDGAIRVVQQALDACYQRGNASPTAAELVSEVDAMAVKGRVHGWKTSALRALESLRFGDVVAAQAVSQKQTIRSLVGSSSIVELNGMASNAKEFLVPMLFLWIYLVRLGDVNREALRLVLILDEAHHFLSRGGPSARETVMEMLLRQCRELGIGVIALDQHPSLLSPAVLGNVFGSICLNLKDTRDINRGAGLSHLENDEKQYLTMLPVGEGIVKLQDRWRRPFLVRFPEVRVPKGVVTDTVLASHARRPWSGSAWRTALAGEGGQVRRVPLAERPLSAEALRFLGDVLGHEMDGVKARYLRLGLSGHKGNRIKEELVADGWLQDEVVPVGKSRKLLLRLTNDARSALGIASSATGVPSLAHEFWKFWYARRLKTEGYAVTPEAPRRGGRVDILATRDGERIGVEVETGNSDAIANVRHCLASGFGTVLVVATDDDAMTIVERQMARAGLLVPGRVRLVLRDAFGAAGFVAAAL